MGIGREIPRTKTRRVFLSEAVALDYVRAKKPLNLGRWYCREDNLIQCTQRRGPKDDESLGSFLTGLARERLELLRSYFILVRSVETLFSSSLTRQREARSWKVVSEHSGVNALFRNQFPDQENEDSFSLIQRLHEQLPALRLAMENRMRLISSWAESSAPSAEVREGLVDEIRRFYAECPSLSPGVLGKRTRDLAEAPATPEIKRRKVGHLAESCPVGALHSEEEN